jgi:hypothetical protein
MEFPLLSTFIEELASRNKFLGIFYDFLQGFWFQRIFRFVVTAV